MMRDGTPLASHASESAQEPELEAVAEAQEQKKQAAPQEAPKAEKPGDEPAKHAAPESAEKPADEAPEKQEAPERLLRRLDKLTAMRARAQQQRDEAMRLADERAEQLSRAMQHIQTLSSREHEAGQPSANAPERPQKQDFETPDDYAAALAEWSAGRAVEQVRRELAQERARDARQQEVTAAAKLWEGRLQEARQRYPDFDAVAMAPALPITEVMGQRIARSPVGLDIWYYLGQHPQEAARISKMDAADAIEEIGALSASFRLAQAEPAEAEQQQPARAPPPKEAAAPKLPAPIRPTQARGATYQRPLGELSMDEYAARRNQERPKR